MAGMLTGVSVLAATSINLSPATINVKTGQTFTVPVSVNPQGVKNYTVELKLNFPADLLQVNSFAFGSQWMAVGQPGYDLIDNTNGVLIKTAGYPQGFTSNIQLGTVTFQAKKSGTGVIALAGGTMALDQSNQNLFAGSSQVAISISAPTVKATVAPGQPTVQPSQSPVATGLTTPVPSVGPSVQQASLLGSIGNVLNLGTGSKTLGVIVVIIVILLLYWLIRKFLFRKKEGI